MSTLTRAGARRGARATAFVVVAALVSAPVALTSSPASAAVTGTVTSGTASWGLSTYLNSANFGRPNPLASGYVAPATFDATSRTSTWGAGTGTVAADGSADLAFDGSSVNFAATGGGWLRLTDLEADVDASGNGSVSAIVEYGLADGVFPNIRYDANQAPVRGPERVDLVDLVGNTADQVTLGAGTASYDDLVGTWSAELGSFLAGDPEGTPAVAEFAYASTVSSADGRTPLPFDLTVSTVAPAVTVTTTSASYADGLALDVRGTGFRPVTNPGDAGVYVGLAEAGGLPDVSSPAGTAAFAAVAYRPTATVVDGAFTAPLVAPTAKLDPSKTYSVYTWQSHTHSNTTQDTETPVEIDWTQLAAPAATPAVSYETVDASYEDGLELSVSGTGFTGVTNPGDNGVYVGLAESGELPDVSDRDNTELFAGVNWVPAAAITDGAFTTTVAAETADLDPATSYSLYTWQAHTHSNTTQDTETPVEIDWSQLEPPVTQTPVLTFSGSTGQRHGTTTWVGVSVEGADTGSVTLTGVGGAQTAAVQYDRAAFRVPAALAAGSYTATFTLTSPGAETVTKTQAFTVLPGVSTMNYSFTRAPSSAAPGYVLVAPSAPNASVPKPTGVVAAKIYLNNKVVATITTKQLVNGQVVLAVPRLAPGRYVFHVAYGGSANLLASHSSRYIQVR